MPKVILKGKVMAKAIGKYKLGLALGAVKSYSRSTFFSIAFNVGR